MYSKKEPIIIYPGCVTFTHHSFFSYVELIRKSFNLERIKVLVFTWDEDFNNDYASELKQLIEVNDSIEPFFIKEKYSDPKFISYLNNIKKGQLTHTPFIKKFLIFYSIGRLIEEIGKINKNSIIFKVRSGFDFKTENYYGSFLKDIEFNYRDLKFYLDRETFTTFPSEDIFWCNRMNSSGISEVIWHTSYSTASKLFGPDVTTLSNNFKLILNKYLSMYPDLSTEQLFEEDYFPHSGPHMVKELSELTMDNFVASVLPFYIYFCFSLGPINPLVYFYESDNEYKTKIVNQRSIPHENRKNLILDPKEVDIRAKRFL